MIKIVLKGRITRTIWHAWGILYCHAIPYTYTIGYKPFYEAEMDIEPPIVGDNFRVGEIGTELTKRTILSDGTYEYETDHVAEEVDKEEELKSKVEAMFLAEQSRKAREEGEKPKEKKPKKKKWFD